MMLRKKTAFRRLLGLNPSPSIALQVFLLTPIPSLSQEGAHCLLANITPRLLYAYYLHFIEAFL